MPGRDQRLLPRLYGRREESCCGRASRARRISATFRGLLSGTGPASRPRSRSRRARSSRAPAPATGDSGSGHSAAYNSERRNWKRCGPQRRTSPGHRGDSRGDTAWRESGGSATSRLEPGWAAEPTWASRPTGQPGAYGARLQHRRSCQNPDTKMRGSRSVATGRRARRLDRTGHDPVGRAAARSQVHRLAHRCPAHEIGGVLMASGVIVPVLAADRRRFRQPVVQHRLS